jgi:hypothetical protein
MANLVITYSDFDNTPEKKDGNIICCPIQRGWGNNCQGFSYCFGGKKSVWEMYECNTRGSEETKSIWEEQFVYKWHGRKHSRCFDQCKPENFIFTLDQITAMAHLKVLPALIYHGPVWRGSYLQIPQEGAWHSAAYHLLLRGVGSSAL